jgi:hypothetical protein
MAATACMTRGGVLKRGWVAMEERRNEIEGPVIVGHAAHAVNSEGYQGRTSGECKIVGVVY